MDKKNVCLYLEFCQLPLCLHGDANSCIMTSPSSAFLSRLAFYTSPRQVGGVCPLVGSLSLPPWGVARGCGHVTRESVIVAALRAGRSFPPRRLEQIHFLSAPSDAIQNTGNDISVSPARTRPPPASPYRLPLCSPSAVLLNRWFLVGFCSNQLHFM